MPDETIIGWILPGVQYFPGESQKIVDFSESFRISSQEAGHSPILRYDWGRRRHGADDNQNKEPTMKVSFEDNITNDGQADIAFPIATEAEAQAFAAKMRKETGRHIVAAIARRGEMHRCWCVVEIREIVRKPVIHSIPIAA